MLRANERRSRLHRALLDGYAGLRVLVLRWQKLVGVSGFDIDALDVLWFLGPMSITQLSRLIGVTRSAGSQLVRRLEEADLLERRPDPRDARRQLVSITNTGFTRGWDAAREFLRDLTVVGHEMDDEARERVLRITNRFETIVVACAEQLQALDDDAFYALVDAGQEPSAPLRIGARIECSWETDPTRDERFPDLDGTLVSSVFHAFCKFRFLILQWQRACGVNAFERVALDVLWCRGAMSISDLSRHVMISRSAGSQLVRRLSRMRLIELRDDSLDGRRKTIQLTDRVHEIVAPLTKPYLREIETLHRSMSIAEHDALERALALGTVAVEAHYARLLQRDAPTR